MKLAVTNLPMLRAELRAYLNAGYKRSQLIVFRMPDRRGRLLSLDRTIYQLRDSHPAIAQELEDRARKEIRTPADMLCIELSPDGNHRIGLLAQKKRVPYSILKAN